MTDEMKEKLLATGLTKQQVNSVTADAIMNFLMSQEDKVLVEEARKQVDEAKRQVREMGVDSLRFYNELSRKKLECQEMINNFEEQLKDVSQTIADIVDSSNNYGQITGEKAKEVVALYGALLTMNKSAGVVGERSVIEASYIMYAFLGGQAKREITTVQKNEACGAADGWEELPPEEQYTRII